MITDLAFYLVLVDTSVNLHITGKLNDDYNWISFKDTV